jgi:signal transduction histidine kinase
VRNLLRLKELGDDLERRNEHLRRLEAMQKELTDLVVHDMKAPVAGASVNIEFAMEMLEPGQAMEALQDALSGVQRLRMMCEEILMLARIEDARMPVQPEPIVVGSLVDDAVRTLGRAAARRGTQLEVGIADGLKVNADPSLLRRVVENLLDNAMRHAPRGGRVAVLGDDDGAVRLRVANTGVPIPVLERTRIFEKFAQSTGAVRRGANVGLGLHFCHAVAMAHGGSIQVDETDEWPVVFTLSIPN